MTLKLDQSTDYSHKELYRLFNGIKIASFVNEADIDTVVADKALGKSAFADVHNMAFPIDKPASVYVSNAFFLDKRAALERRWGKDYTDIVASRIKTSAEIFQIDKEVADYTAQHLAKQAKDYSEEYIYEGTWEGSPVTFFNVKTSEDFRNAAKEFADNLFNYTFDMRKGISDGFVSKAAEFQIDELPDIICKYAGLFFPDAVQIKNDLYLRSTKTAQEELKSEYLELQKKADGLSTREEFFKLAQEVFDIENSFGLYNDIKVAKELRDPVDAFFDISFEKAAELLSVIPMAGENFAIASLSDVPASVYKEAFGIDIDPANTSDLRDTLPTMPHSDVSLFKELSGVTSI